LAIELARALGCDGVSAEIVNADSMLVYRGMDIGTAKPSFEERAGVPHHLIDIMDVRESASVAVFRDLARASIADVRARGGVPILVGGSALYLHAIVDRFDFPPTDDSVRARLEQELEDKGAPVLYTRLQTADPKAAAGILPTNGRRIVRALEALELTGSFTPTLPAWEYALDNVVQIGLDLDRPEMDKRIEARVHAMWEHGLVEEVRGLLDHGLRQGKTASRAIGYAQTIAYIDQQVTADQAKESTTIRTRQFSRKQLSWWRRDPRIHWARSESVSVDDIRALVTRALEDSDRVEVGNGANETTPGSPE
jgi:tRNA dimethylallyltransferase